MIQDGSAHLGGLERQVAAGLKNRRAVGGQASGRLHLNLHRQAGGVVVYQRAPGVESVSAIHCLIESVLRDERVDPAWRLVSPLALRRSVVSDPAADPDGLVRPDVGSAVPALDGPVVVLRLMQVRLAAGWELSDGRIG